MAALPYSIARYAYDAGFRGADLVTAVAVAYAESAGNPRTYNPETAAGTPQGLGSYGLWQIYRKAHPQFATWDLYDPATNARAAYQVWKQAGGSFRPWSTFKHGSHLKFMARATAEVGRLKLGSSASGWLAVAAGVGIAAALWFGAAWWTRRQRRLAA